MNRLVAQRMLERLGHRPDFAEDGAQALAKLSEADYDVVLMDVQMPVLDGLQATAKILETYGEQRPWIIGLTAGAMKGDREICLEAGMDDYVTKPVRLEVLQAALQSASGAEDESKERRTVGDRSGG